jgi:hypothetical protein
VQVYRRYELDEQGAILRGEWFEAASDQDALAQIRAGAAERTVEVWQHARRIGRVEGPARQ